MRSCNRSKRHKNIKVYARFQAKFGVELSFSASVKRRCKKTSYHHTGRVYSLCARFRQGEKGKPVGCGAAVIESVGYSSLKYSMERMTRFELANPTLANG